MVIACPWYPYQSHAMKAHWHQIVLEGRHIGATSKGEKYRQ